MLVLGLVDIPLWLLAIPVLLVALYVYGMRPYSYWPKRNIPQPSHALPFIGSLLSVIKVGFRKYVIQQVKQHGRVYGTYSFGKPSLVVADTEMIKQICIKDFDCFTDRLPTPFFSSKPLDASVFAQKGRNWKRIRHLLTPTFTSGKLKAMFPEIEDAAKVLCKKLDEAVGSSEVSIMDYCVNFTMDVIASTMFGLRINCQENHDNAFKTFAQKLLRINIFNPKVLFSIMFPSLSRKLFEIFNITVWPSDCMAFFVDVVTKALKERRETEGRYNDFLASILTAEEEAQKAGEAEDGGVLKGLSEEEVLAQALFFFFAGFDTTANTIHYVLYFLALNPECDEKCFEEIQRAGELNYETVMNMRYLSQCVDETLRMTPAAVMTDRVCTKATTIKGYEIEEGIQVTIPIHFLAHDEEVWEAPETFKPERFDPEVARQRDPLTHIPFGSGPRSCIGMRLALMEVRKGLAEILRHFRFEPVGSTTKFEDLQFQTAGVAAAPTAPIKLRVLRR